MNKIWNQIYEFDFMLTINILCENACTHTKSQRMHLFVTCSKIVQNQSGLLIKLIYSINLH